jgi:hypothetical protein
VSLRPSQKNILTKKTKRNSFGPYETAKLKMIERGLELFF